jgi:5'-methylthioadenosine phosphorylase
MRDARADVGIFGGSGLYDLGGLEDARDVTLGTPFGAPSARLRLGVLSGRRVAFLARHGEFHRLLPTEIPYRANVWAMKRLGVRVVFSPSAVGSLREDLPPRTLVVPDQIVDRTRHRETTFFGDGLVVHVSMADPFSAAVRQALLAGARDVGVAARDGGTYLCMEGPPFSTRAESRWYRSLGADVIGMTAGSEARLCREAEIAYASLSLVTDYDAWRAAEAPVSAEEILAVLRANTETAIRVVGAALAHVPELDLPEHRSLDTALVTPLDKVPAETRRRLAPLLARVLARRRVPTPSSARRGGPSRRRRDGTGPQGDVGDAGPSG